MEKKSDKTGAILLAAGQGKRMKSQVQKQFMELEGKPLIWYSLRQFEKSPVEEIVLVTGEDEVEYCQRDIIEKYHFSKVIKVVAGGKERYHSVYEGLKAFEDRELSFVLIHDGARPLVSLKTICDSIEQVRRYEACAAAVPVKDTIKVSDKEQYAAETPPRNLLWQVQTPQSFSYPLIFSAYKKLFSGKECMEVTDDAMVVETMTDKRVKLVMGDYRNIKVTTPEDMILARAFLQNQPSGK